MQKIIPHLWYDKEAKEAAEFYVSLFPDSTINSVNVIKDTPSGDCDIVSFNLSGYEFMSISAGPMFKFTPSISFIVNFDPSRDDQALGHLDKLWEELSEGGTVRMPKQEYPFSKRYGWVEDKYGVNWQLILTNPEGEERPFIMPSLMFTGDVCGKTEEAIAFYSSVFKNAKTGMVARYPAGMDPDKEGTVMFADFTLENQWFAAMDSAREHKSVFNEAISFIVKCIGQAEIDHYWERLSAVPEAEQCGWLKDKFGVSWQITPVEMDDMMETGTDEQKERVTKAFLAMKKFDVAKLKDAYEGN